MQAIFDTTRDQVLRDHLWNFAKKRQNLNRNTTAPLFEWTFSYKLPADSIRALRVGTTDAVPWRLEGRNILTDEEAVSLLYIFREQDLSQWDPAAYDAFATRLASKLAASIAHDITFSNGLYEQYKILILDAAAIDSQQGTPETVFIPDLIDIRTVP